MRRRSLPTVLACLLAAGALIAGCGGSDSTTSPTAAAPESRPAPPKSDFPSAAGRTLGEVLNLATGGPSELVVSPAAKTFYVGENRYPFGVFKRDHTQVADAKIALYFAKVPKKKNSSGKGGSGKGGPTVNRTQEKALDQPAVGPFPASIESMATQPAFRAQTTADDLGAATVVYSTNVDFPSNGEWRIAALIEQDGEMTAALLSSALVGEFKRVPRPGDRAPLIHTPTPADVGGDLSQITTRIPPDTQNEVDFADVLGKEPIVLLFATPQFCESRVCGPVVDVAEQVKQLKGDKAAFIHMEIWKENDPGTEEVRPQVNAYHLPSEPWLFVIDAEGKVRETIEGAFGPQLLSRALKGVTGE